MLKKGLPFLVGLSFFVILFLIGAPAQASLDAIDPAVREEYNQAVERIYGKIISVKSSYPELQNFSRKMISRDKNGFDLIFYSYGLEAGENESYAYQFSLNVDEIQSKSMEGEWKFPLLGFQVVLNSHQTGNFTIFKSEHIVEEGLDELKMFEQQSLPFRLELKTDKDVYAPKERITLTVLLKNTGQQAFKVADISEQSLYCQIDTLDWGTRGGEITLDKVLSPYGSITKIFKIQGIDTPKEARISCAYGLGFKGVQPFNHVQISIKSPD